MRILFYLLAIMVFISCKTSQNYKLAKTVFTDLKLDKCYHSLKVDKGKEMAVKPRYNLQEKSEKPYILEIIPAEFKETEKLYKCSELKSKFNIEGYLNHPIKSSYHKYEINNKDFMYSSAWGEFYGFKLCHRKIRTRTQLFKEEDLETDSIKIKEEILVRDAKMIKYFIKDKPEDLNENQFYIEGGTWTIPKESEYKERGHGGYSIRDIKNKLIELNYPLAPDNLLSPKTKEALLDFQMKNGLPEGQLDFETLEKLGIKM